MIETKKFIQMDIFIYGIPAPSLDFEVVNLLKPHLHKLGVTDGSFKIDKPKAKGFANLHIFDKAKGEIVLATFSMQTDIRLSHRFPLKFRKNFHQDGGDQANQPQRSDMPRVPQLTSLESQLEGNRKS